jgi:signal peptidase I
VSRGGTARLAERRWVLLAVGLLGSAVLFRAQVIDTMSVESDSMAPTICDGDRLVVSKLGSADDLGRDDLVVFRSPADGDRAVKRVVAVEGQRVEIRDGVLFVDRERRDEAYVDPATMDGAFFGPTVVDEGAVFLLGDHREVSIDSRDYGAVPRDLVEGRVLTTLWSSCTG